MTSFFGSTNPQQRSEDILNDLLQEVRNTNKLLEQMIKTSAEEQAAGNPAPQQF